MPSVRDLLHLRPFQSDKDKVCIPKNLASHDAPALDSTTTTPPSAPQAVGQSLTVVELFQSQGCSSCPPANDNVISLVEDADKLVLTYEVTYWDYIGWPDTFGRKEWDLRQRDYQAAFKSRSVYTPQVIVNGLSAGVGSRKSEVASLLQDGKAYPLAGSVSVSVVDGQVAVSGPAGMRGIVQLALYDPRGLDVQIRAGENRGRTLPHRNIVRELLVLGWWEGGDLKFALPETNVGEGLKAAVLVQKGRGGPIIGAAKV